MTYALLFAMVDAVLAHRVLWTESMNLNVRHAEREHGWWRSTWQR